jgi:hypothetical protein
MSEPTPTSQGNPDFEHVPTDPNITDTFYQYLLKITSSYNRKVKEMFATLTWYAAGKSITIHSIP